MQGVTLLIGAREYELDYSEAGLLASWLQDAYQGVSDDELAEARDRVGFAITVTRSEGHPDVARVLRGRQLCGGLARLGDAATRLRSEPPSANRED